MEERFKYGKEKKHRWKRPENWMNRASITKDRKDNILTEERYRHPLRRQTKNSCAMIHNWDGSYSKILNFTLRSEDLYVTLGTPTLRSSVKETNSKCWALKTNGDYVQENHRSVGKGRHSLKGFMHRHTPQELSTKMPI